MAKHEINIQIGQCGMGIGFEFWKQVSSQHSIDPNGRNLDVEQKDSSENKDILLRESHSGKFYPRAILLDLEPRANYNFEVNTLRSFFDSKNILTENFGTGNSWSNGYHRGVELEKVIENLIRKEIEDCDNRCSVSLFHSLGGGTGSGLGCSVIEIIDEYFPEISINSHCVIPNQSIASDVVIQPYNTVLSFRWLKEYCDYVVLYENDSIEKILGIKEINNKICLKQINSLIASVSSAMTFYKRFPRIGSFVNNDFLNLFNPIPNLHFYFSSICPKNMPSIFPNKMEFTDYPFPDNSKAFSIPFISEEGKLISSFHFPILKNQKTTKKNDIFQNSNLSKKKFIEWAPVPIISNFRYERKDKFKNIESEVTLFNHTSVKSIFINTLKMYNVLKKRNAFLTNYLSGFSRKSALELFDDSRFSLEELINDYEICSSFNYT